MGIVCRKYFICYSVLASVDFLFALYGIILMSGEASVCKAICPLSTTDGQACALVGGMCTRPQTCVAKADVLAMEVRAAYDDGCYVCDGATVMWPNFRSRGALQWQPAASCPGLNEGAGVLADEYTHCWSTPLEMSMRNIATPLLWVQVIGFLVQSIGFMLAAVGMRQFAGKYADDWKRLRRFEVWIGTVVKQFPKYARYLNLALLALLGLQIAMFFFVGVCKDAENDYGGVTFYPQAQAFLGMILGYQLIACVSGTLFRSAVPMETPFYEPRILPDEDANKCVRFCWEPFTHKLQKLGP